MKSWADRVFKKTDTLPLTALEPGIALAAADLVQVFRLAWWISDEAQPAFRAHLPGAASIPLDWERTLMHPHQQGDVLWLGSPPPQAPWDTIHRVNRAASVIQQLPDQTRLELAISGPRPMRFQGVLEAGHWHLKSLYPAANGDLFRRALELSRQAQDDDWLDAASPEIAAAAETTLKADLSLQDGTLLREGCRLKAVDSEGEGRTWLLLFGSHLMAHDPEFCETWSLQERRQELLDQCEEDLTLSGLAAQLTQSVNAHFGIMAGESVYQGKMGAMQRSNMRQCPWLRPEEVDHCDQELLELGFEAMGDLTAEAAAGVVIRAYCCAQGDCWAVVNAGIHQLFVREFFSQAQDGSCLTTTSLPFADSKPEQKLEKQSWPEQSWSGLLSLHRQEVARRGWLTRPCGRELVDIAASMDEYLAQFGTEIS
jgi:hypothetical protein